MGLKLAIPSSRCRLYVEREAACCEVLALRMEEGALDQAPIFTDLRSLDGRPWRGRIHCLIGGIPCQPHSIAGEQQGVNDPRDLWPDTRRLITEIEPPYVIIENVANFVNTILFDVGRDFQEMGYLVEAGLFSAEEVGAPHKRERLFILASSEFKRTGGDVADPGDTRLPESECPPPGRKGRRDEGRTIAEFSGAQIYADIEPFPPGPADLDKWRDIIAVRPDLAPAVSQEEAEAQSKLRGLDDELDPWMDRVDRLRAGGNGVVPLQAAYGICLLAASLGSRCRGE